MCSRNDDPTQHEARSWEEHQEEITAFVEAGPTHSPWVRRNEDCAQYEQPRGSEYEGSDR